MIGQTSLLLQQASAETLASLLAVGAAAALASVVVLGLRLVRRGPARFWLAPAFVGLALVPIACGTAFWAAGVRRTAEGAAIMGASAGGMAVRAGLAEAVLPLIVGAVAAFGVASLGFLLVALGRRREGAAVSTGTASSVPLAASAALAILALTLVLGVLVAARGAEASYAAELARALAWAAGGLALVLLVAAFPLALRSPRGPAPRSTRLLALLVPAAVAATALVAAGVATAFVASVASELRPLSEPTTALAPAAATTPPAASPRPSTPVRAGTDVKEPRKLVHVAPRYPPEAIQARLQGKVVLECVVGPDGRVSDVEVKRGIPLLDDAARDAVRQWVYEPTLVDGVAVPVTVTVTVSFDLR